MALLQRIFLSSVFSVAIFYIYIAFIEHPDIKNGYIMGADNARSMMSYCLYIIAIFSFIFILYSSSSFIKTRKKEFGLLSLFGMTRFQLRKLVFFENMSIGLLSTVVGIGAGILFLKLFLLALGAVLNLEEVIRFAVPASSLSTTFIVFCSIFTVITLYSCIRIGKGEIVDLLHAYRKPKGEIKYSPWLAALGFLFLAGGYTLAYLMDIYTFAWASLLILILTIAGTYLLYTQLSVVVLRLLRKNKRLFYNRSNLLIISQLVYKIKDNAKILFTISILSAVVMTSMGAIYIITMTGEKNILASSSYTIMLMEGEAVEGAISRAELLEQFEKHGMDVSKETKFEGLLAERYKVKLDGIERTVGTSDPDPKNGYGGFINNALVMPLSQYERITSTTLQLEQGKAYLLMNIYPSAVGKAGVLNGNIGEDEISLPIQSLNDDVPINMGMNYLGALVVVWDEQYNELAKNAYHKLITLYGYDIDNWKKGYPVVTELNDKYASQDKALSNISMWRISDYYDFMQFMSLTIFIGLFISLLFFIASGSLIYFKLYTERDEDIQMFKGLNRIGISYSEMKKVVVSQIAIVFFLPCIVGVFHAGFAMIALDNLLTVAGNESNWTYSFVVFGIYVVLQTLYFVLSSRSYLTSIRRGSSTTTE